jgi:hypothetical protein
MTPSPAKFEVRWRDAGREPQCPPNPAYPDGIDVDGSGGAAVTCTVVLPCPAKRCGAWEVRCQICGYSALVSTAGRPDDPRSVRLPCKIAGTRQ